MKIHVKMFLKETILAYKKNKNSGLYEKGEKSGSPTGY